MDKRKTRNFTSISFRRRSISLFTKFFVFLFFVIICKIWVHSKENINNSDVLKSFNVQSSANITQNKVQICNNKNVCSFWSPGYWRESDLQEEHIYYNIKTIKVPMGMNVFLITQNDKRLSIPLGITICSYQDICESVAKLDISANLRLALDQIAQFIGEDRQQELIHQHKTELHFVNDDVTLVSQFSVNRLERFERAVSAWPGPISAVIYLTSPLDINKLVQYFQMDKNIYLYNRVTLTIVKPDYSTEHYLEYPINKLRNIGIKSSLTEFIFVIDVDIIPSSKLHQFTISNLIPLLKYNNNYQPTAFIVPSVTIKENYPGQLPNTISDLRNLFKKGWAYINGPYISQGPTNINIFLSHRLFKNFPYYEICYESNWEPFYILSKLNSPLYDERFKNQGGDKQQHTLSLNALGFKFLVLYDHFIYHLDHKKSIWPGGGLRQGQLSENQFTYLNSYIPEMQSIFGLNVRWPKGCKFPLVKEQMKDLLGIGVG